MNSDKSNTQQTDDRNLAAALELLQRQAHQLFPKEDDAEQFRALLRRCAHETGQPDESSPDAANAEALDLSSLAELVHAVSRIEDTVTEVRHAADVVSDWVAKGGRSLGID